MRLFETIKRLELSSKIWKIWKLFVLSKFKVIRSAR